MSNYGKAEAEQDYNETGVAFYTALAEETGGPVLEIACGTGRVSIPIARLGLTVTGLDIAPEMLELARRKSGGLPIRWIEADGRAFNLGEQFRLILVAGNAFQMFLTNADQEALLGRVHAHLDEDGLFAFETRNPLWGTPLDRADLEAVLERARLRTDLFTFLESRDQEEVWQTYTDSSGRDVTEFLSQTYDHAAQILHLTNYHRWREGDQEQTEIGRESLRYTFPQELAALLHYNGFTIIRQFGDWNLEPLTATSTSIIVVCRKRA
ncbi:MAG: methyltransferase domain-containing protein [Dehalococcoidia bacterium]|nr:methyltransferase domain-containing protein [Dehalococcoidia bacterium]